MKFLNSNRALCLSPHPDDVEYAMGGTILKCGGTEFHLCHFSQGGEFDPTNGPERDVEAFRFWDESGANLGSGLQTLWGYTDEAEAIARIEEERVMGKFDTIFIPAIEDTHHYHRFVNNIGQALCRVRPINLIEYAAPSVKPSWTPNLAVDISDHYEEKKERLKAFKSQQHHTYFKDHCLDAFHTDLHHAKKGLRWIERFKILNAYG